MTEPITLHYMHSWCGMFDQCKTYMVFYLKKSLHTTSDYGKISHRLSKLQGA
jgi:hypothetical protein